jgi:1-aminocyclopropane-1-carboxylate deaminase
MRYRRNVGRDRSRVDGKAAGDRVFRLKGGEFLDEDVAALQKAALGHTTDNWRIETRFHFRGFAKRTAELDAFIDRFEQDHGIRLDWVYVAKMMYGIFELLEAGEFPPGSTVMAVVTG